MLNKSGNQGKIQWLSVLQGWSMLLVVIGHVTLTNKYGDPSTPIATAIEAGIGCFHMPLFILISGWLFYRTVINKQKKYKEVILSKLQRLGIPFLAFTLATIVLKVIASPLMNRHVDMLEIINTFILFRSNPLREMWFVTTLFILMAMYPLYKLSLKNKFFEIIGIIVALYLHYSFPQSVSYYQLNKVASMLIFFYFGILICKYDFVKYINNKTVLITSLFVFIVLRCEFIPSYLFIISQCMGIIFSFSFCLNISSRFPQLFHTFRNYTFQIYLTGIFFQMAIRFVYTKLNLDIFYLPLYLFSILVGLYAPVFISKLIQRINIRFINRCFGL